MRNSVDVDGTEDASHICSVCSSVSCLNCATCTAAGLHILELPKCMCVVDVYRFSLFLLLASAEARLGHHGTYDACRECVTKLPLRDAKAFRRLVSSCKRGLAADRKEVGVSTGKSVR